MTRQSAQNWLIALIFILALFSAIMGLFYHTPGEPYAFETLHGEEVTIYGRGLYQNETLSYAIQEISQDWVTLLVGLPLLAISSLLAARGSLRGKLLLTGTLGYFLYTYTSMAFGAAYNQLFLVYVALFSMSLYAFIFSILSIDVQTLPQRFLDRLPRGWIAALLFLVGGFLTLAWLGRIVPPLLQGSPPEGIENSTTLFIQALDLGLVAPLAFLAGILLLRRRPWGYLLSSVVLIKGLTLGLAVSTMAVNMTVSGVPVSPVELVIFPLISFMNVIMVVILLKHVQSSA